MSSAIEKAAQDFFYSTARKDKKLSNQILNEKAALDKKIKTQAARIKELEAALKDLSLAVNTMYLWVGSDDGAQAIPFEPEWNKPLRDAYDKARAALNGEG